MADIKQEREHGLTLAQARAVAQQAADDLARKYDLASHWDGDTLRFRRGGVEGEMKVAPGRIALEVTLGFMLRPFKASIEQQIGRKLDALLAQAPAAADRPGARAEPRGGRKAAAADASAPAAKATKKKTPPAGKGGSAKTRSA